MAIRVRLAFPALDDPVRGVRIEAARILASVPTGDLPAEQQARLDGSMNEYIEEQQAMAERPEAQVNLGNLRAARGEAAQAAAAYRTATELDPAFAPAYVNLADFHRSRGEEAKTEKVLRQAASVLPGSGDIQYALGLSLVRQKRTGEAIEALRQAARLSPDSARYAYVYAVALNSSGDTQQAVLVLQGAHNRFPNDVDILEALVAFHRDLGNQSAARSYADKLRSSTQGD